MDFRSYADGKSNGGDKANGGNGNDGGAVSNDYNGYARQNINNFAAGDINRVNNVVNRYADKSDDAMLNDLMSMVSEQKRAGKLNNADLDNFARSAANMLTQEQKSKMLNLINVLKQNN
jgi:hypothetical protein